MAELTKRQSEALAVIKAAGPKGIGFKDLKKKLNVKGVSTMRQRLGTLTDAGVVNSVRNGKFATYIAV